MKLTITAEEWRGLRCVRAVAKMPKSKKTGVPHKLQKTWTVKTVAPEFAVEEMRPAFEANAKRWEAKQMAKIARQKELDEAVEKMNKQIAKEHFSEPFSELKAKLRASEALAKESEVTPPPTPARNG